MQTPLFTVAEHGRGSLYEPVVAPAGPICQSNGTTSATIPIRNIVRRRSLRIAVLGRSSVAMQCRHHCDLWRVGIKLCDRCATDARTTSELRLCSTGDVPGQKPCGPDWKWVRSGIRGPNPSRSVSVGVRSSSWVRTERFHGVTKSTDASPPRRATVSPVVERSAASAGVFDRHGYHRLCGQRLITPRLAAVDTASGE